MFQFITLRILKGALTFLAAITVTFLIVRLMPGDPTTAFISDSMSPQDVAALNTLLGLDRSLFSSTCCSFAIWPTWRWASRSSSKSR